MGLSSGTPWPGSKNQAGSHGPGPPFQPPGSAPSEILLFSEGARHFLPQSDSAGRSPCGGLFSDMVGKGPWKPPSYQLLRHREHVGHESRSLFNTSLQSTQDQVGNTSDHSPFSFLLSKLYIRDAVNTELNHSVLTAVDFTIRLVFNPTFMLTFYPNIFFNATASSHSLLVFKLILENVIQIWWDGKEREGDWSQVGWCAGPGVRERWRSPSPRGDIISSPKNEANLWLAGSLWRLDGIAWIKESSIIPNP